MAVLRSRKSIYLLKDVFKSLYRSLGVSESVLNKANRMNMEAIRDLWWIACLAVRQSTLSIYTKRSHTLSRGHVSQEIDP